MNFLTLAQNNIKTPCRWCRCTETCSNAYGIQTIINPLNAELNPICYLLALLGAHHFLHVSRIRVNTYVMHLLVWILNCTYFFIVVPCCMLFQSLLYCSNSCTSLHFKTLKSHTKTLKISPYMFRSPLNTSSGGPWQYFAMILNWYVDLHLL